MQNSSRNGVVIANLKELFRQRFGESVIETTTLPGSGSYRVYYRMEGANQSVLGVFNEDKKENIAFVEFSKQFKEQGIRVPEIYAERLDLNIYLIEDFGDETLYNYIKGCRDRGDDSGSVESVYRSVIQELPKLQTVGAESIDYSLCYPRSAFDKQSMMWDLNYFKYYFLKLAKVPFDEQDLESDFNTFTEYLLSERSDYFLYRDFQSRNIMIDSSGEICFIDYQGGRRGALQYDLASLLYDAKADITPQFREEMLDYYLDILSAYVTVDREQFKEYYTGFVLIRIMQAMGAYGFRGFYEKKEHFLQSIPYALNNLDYILTNSTMSVDMPELLGVLNRLKESEVLQQICKEKEPLTITINSFSYKKGIPVDSNNGGGFVFDCRAIHNPGRYEEYKYSTGLEGGVKEFFKREPEMYSFLSSAYSMIDLSLKNYIERGFTSLQINFGCTGGQHRSVYSAEKMAAYIKRRYREVTVEVYHTNSDNWLRK